MANRVLLDADRMKVSAPGQNVLTASDTNLIFSSEWAGAGIVQQGTYNVTVGSWSGYEHLKNLSDDIPLVKTFPTPPIVFLFEIRGDYWTPVAYGTSAAWGGVRETSSDYALALIQFTTTTTQLQIRGIFNREATPTLATPTASFRYIILDFNT